MTVTAADVEALVDELLAGWPPDSTSAEEFLGAQFDLGLAWIDHPVGFGGLGAAPKLQEIVIRRLYDAGAPSARLRNPIGVGHAAPTIMAYGTDEQRRRYLRPLFSSAEYWCQLFSEPGAGSDLANLSTRAERDGDQWVINGQKVWTSLAHAAHQSMLLTRSDPSVPKHNGLTYFVIDMTTPGIEIRPLRQMTGEAEFNEVFLNDVRLPDSARLGPVNEGWRVAITTLMNEREANAATIAPRGSGAIGEAVRLYVDGRTSGRLANEQVVRDRLMRSWVEAETNRLTSLRVSVNRDRGVVGPEGSIGKLAASLINQRVMKLCIDLLGIDGLGYPGYEFERAAVGGAHQDDAAMASAGWLADSFERRDEPEPLTDAQILHGYLRSMANQIEAGSSQVMRNIIGERVLGLPGEPRVDRDKPWNA